jgi:hypothetical protein
MSNEISRPGKTGQNLPTPTTKGTFIDSAFGQLTAEQKKRMAELAAERGIQLEVADYEASRKFHASGAEMERAVDLAKQHEQMKSDFTINSEFQTASGRTTVRVSRANNTLFIVIAVVIAVVFFVLFSK